MYRLVAAPALLYFIFSDQPVLFRWLLVVSFFTDAIDGYLARRHHVTSRFGARLDSMADDFTVLAAIVGLFVLEPAFLREKYAALFVVLTVFVVQNVLALVRYGRLTSFHTYLAKTAAVVQAMFFLLLFFERDTWATAAFYAAVFVTFIELIEESIMVLLLPAWQVNVKGLYWVLKGKTDDD